MSSQHKAPLAAFLVVSIACIVVVVNAVRSEAFSTFLERQTPAIDASVPMIPEPQRVVVTEARAVVKAKAGLQVAPQVVKQVVSSAGHSVHAGQPTKRHHSASAGTPHAAAVPAPATVPVTAAVSAPAPITAPPVTAPVTHGHAGPAPQTPAVSQPLASAHGQLGHLSDATPVRGKGWTRSRYDDHGHGARGQGGRHASSSRPGAAPTVSSSPAAWSADTWSTGSRSSRGHGNAAGNSRGNGWDDNRANSWSTGSGNGWSGHHGWH